MQAREHERRDWIIIFLILLFGVFCILLASGWALRFSPSWALDTSLDSNLDPNSDFLTRRPGGFIEPIDPAILTNPSWLNVFLTPGASFTTGTPFPMATGTFPVMHTATSMPVTSPTSTFVIASSPTMPLIFIPPTSSSTPKPSGPKPTRTPTFAPTPTFTFTNTPDPFADLQITKTDGATNYTSSGTITYTIVVSNPGGPGNINGATVTDTFPAQIASVNWSCTGAGGATCTANGSGNINDSVNLPVGSSMTYTVSASIIAGASGDLVNTASVSLPAGFTDPVPGNNTATDTDTLITTDPTPGQIGSTPDGNIYNLAAGGTITLNINLVVNGHAGWDLVYYEMPAGSGILLDWVIIEISDGQNWYTIFNWGDNIPDTNSNVDVNILPPPPNEPDQRDISSASLYNSSGVAINLDGVVPPGSYPYMRIYAPPGDTDGQLEIDAIEVLP